MPDPAIDGGSPGASSFSLVPVDHDPFNNPSTNPSFSLVPVDHDPFAVGTTAQPATNSPNNGLGAPNSQYQLSPLGTAGQAVPQYDALQALKYGQPIAPRLMGSLNTGQASASDNQIGALSPDGPIPKPGQTVPVDNPIGAYNAARLQISHALFPGLTDYLTKPPPLPSLVANAAGKLPLTDNPYAVPALLDVAAALGPAAAEKLGLTVGLAATRGAQAVADGAQALAPYAMRALTSTRSALGDFLPGLTSTRPPAAPNLLAEAYHNTFGGVLERILEQGLNEGAYATTSGQLSPLQAQIDLALPPNRGLTNSVLRIDLDALRRDGFEIPPVTMVARKYGMPGGGTEMQFPYNIPPQYIQVVPK
jgi:hypothetical protein